MKTRFFTGLCMLFALEINDDAPQGGSPNAEAMDAAAADDTNDDDATTGIHAVELDDDPPQVQAEPGVETNEQSADGEAELGNAATA